jgi:hypothetical protein
VSFTATDLSTIQTARLRGIRTVVFADRTVTYQSDAEMRQVESDIRASLATANEQPRQFYGVGGKGLCL